MNQTILDHLLANATLAEATDGLDRIADQLIGLHDAWRVGGADDHALAWLGGIIGQLGWWSGRMSAASSPDPDSPGIPDTALR